MTLPAWFWPATTVTDTKVVAGADTWTPSVGTLAPGMTLTVGCWGGGEGGNSLDGIGGFGGSYAQDTYVVTAADAAAGFIAVSIGAGGAGLTTAPGTPGGDTIFGASAVVAPGGRSATSAVGTLVYAGGMPSAGGGGAAGPDGAGIDAAASHGGYGDGGYGGAGGPANTIGSANPKGGGGGGGGSGADGATGGYPGGGGGGSGSLHTAAAGMGGQIKITYAPIGANIAMPREVARGITLVPFNSGMVVVDWTEPTLWPFPAAPAGSGAFSAQIPVTGAAFGFSSAAADASNGLYATTWDGQLFHVASYGAATLLGPLPSGQVYVGTAFAAGSGFAMSTSGHVYTSVGSLLASFPLEARPLVASGSTLMAPMPASGIGTMSALGVTGFIALPGGMSVASCIAAVSGSPLAVGGWTTAAPLSGAVAAALDPQNASVMLAVGSGRALLWGAPGPLADAWSQTQTVSGLASLAAMQWRPDGTQALACSPASGVVQSLAYTLGVLSLAQTLSVSGACSVVVAGDSVHAIVAQSGQSQAMPLVYGGGVWATGTAVTGLAGITSLAPCGASSAAAAVSGGIRYLNLTTGGVWALGASVPLGFTPASVASDQFAQIYAAGSGAVAQISGTVVVASGTWSGATAVSTIVQAGRILLAVPGDSLLRIFGLVAPGTLSQQSGIALSLGSQVGLGLSTTTLFVMGSGGTPTYGFSGSPFALTPVLSGSIAFWGGASWTTTALGVGHLPSAIGLDGLGTAWATTVQNTLWNIATSGTVLSSGVVPQYPGQAPTVPISPSAILASTSGVYIATSIPGVLVQTS